MGPIAASRNRGAAAHGSTPETVREALRLAISSGDLAPGVQLRQDELATRFGTSRIPVREALTPLTPDPLSEVGFHPGFTWRRVDG